VSDELELRPVAARAPVVRRQDARVNAPRRHPQWLVNQLPVGMLGSDFFVRFVSIFQEMAESLMDDADQVQHVPDATVTPTPMLSYLASWIDVRTVDPSLPEAVQRTILRSSAKALAQRGTRRGLEAYLTMLSGEPAEVTDGGGVWSEGQAPDDVAWVRMRVAGTGHLSEDEFMALVEDEIPAHVRAELFVGDRRVLSTEQALERAAVGSTDMTVELPAVSPVDGDGLADGHSGGLLHDPVDELPIDLSTEEA
jgi:phage tail-like protein